MSLIKHIKKSKKLINIEIIIIELDNEKNKEYTELDNLLVENNFVLHICVWYNAVYLKKSRLNKYDPIIFTTDWFDNLIDVNNYLSISKKYNKINL